MKTNAIKIIEGNLLDSPDTYIAHQCNCTGQFAGGVAKVIFEKWPKCDDYIRGTHGEFGSFKVHRVEKEKWVVNMFTQYWGGGPQENLPGNDDRAYDREIMFARCLFFMTQGLVSRSRQIRRPLTVSMPYLIGCGLARGNWNNYLRMLAIFSDVLTANGGQLTLYKLPEKPTEIK